MEGFLPSRQRGVIMKVLRPTVLLFTLAILALFIAYPAVAESCSADCEEALGCYGGCQLSATEECGSYCFSSGCNVSCKEIGPNNQILSCGGGGDSECGSRSGGPNEPPAAAKVGPFSSRMAEWAVLAYRTDQVTPLAEKDVRVLSSSSRAYGAIARDSYRLDHNERLALHAQRAEADGQREIFQRPLDTPQDRTVLKVKPVLGACLKAGIDFGGARFPVYPERSSVFYFRAQLNEAGQVSRVDGLHSEVPSLDEHFVNYLRENLGVTVDEGSPSPRVLFGYLKATPSGAMGHMLLSALAAPAEPEAPES